MAPPGRRWTPRRARIVGLLGLVVAVAVALAVWPAAPWRTHQEPNRTPFYLAVADLAAQPVVHDGGSLPGGTSWDLETTSGGEQLGSLTVAGQRVDVLVVGGRTYVKPPRELLADLPADLPASAVRGKWLTGDDTLTTALPKPTTPARLASALWADLAKATDFPRPGAPTVRIGTVAALHVATPAGELYVSATAPYRVLRLAPATASGKTVDAAPAGSAGEWSGGSGHPVTEAALTRPLAAGGGLDDLGRTDFTPMSPPDVDQMLGDLRDQTRTLSDAVDVGIDFDVQGQGDLNCSETSCTVTETVTSTTTSASDARLSGTVTANLTATVTVNGQAAGGCSGQASLPVNGSGTISCPDPDVAPIVAEIKEQAQEEANEEAEAEGHDVEVPYTLDYGGTAQVWAEADVQAEVDRYVSAEQAEQDAVDEESDPTPCPAGAQNSFAAGTPVLAADGTTEPIQDVRAGDQVADSRAGAAGVEPHVVTAVHVTDSDRDFVVLTVVAGHTTGRITSTAHHLFFDVSAAAWIAAADLEPGDRLQTAGPGSATVQAVRPRTGALRTYNLTVDGVHSYYVEAGHTAVLVHNSDCGPAELGAGIGDGAKQVARGSGQLNHIADGVNRLGLDQRDAATATEAAARRAFGETGGVMRAPNGNLVVLPSQLQVKAWFEVSPQGQVTGMKGVIGTDGSADLNLLDLQFPESP